MCVAHLRHRHEAGQLQSRHQLLHSPHAPRLSSCPTGGKQSNALGHPEENDSRPRWIHSMFFYCISQYSGIRTPPPLKVPIKYSVHPPVVRPNAQPINVRFTCDRFIQDQLPTRFEHSGHFSQRLGAVGGGAVSQEARQHPVKGGGRVGCCVWGGGKGKAEDRFTARGAITRGSPSAGHSQSSSRSRFSTDTRQPAAPTSSACCSRAAGADGCAHTNSTSSPARTPSSAMSPRGRGQRVRYLDVTRRNAVKTNAAPRRRFVIAALRHNANNKVDNVEERR